MAATTRPAPLPSIAMPGAALTWWAACSLGAAAIHFAVIPEHLDEWWAFGIAFAALAWVQAVWPFVAGPRPTARLAWAAILVNLAAVGVWAWSRTAGLPVGPEPGMVEAVGAPDLVATALELALVVGLAGWLLGRDAATVHDGSGANDDARGSSAGLVAWIAVAVVTTVALALGGG